MTRSFELSNVDKRYEHFALSDLSLSLDAGGIMGFIGPNGAGKSTTIRILMGLIQADAGDVTVLGHAMPAEQVQAKQDIGFASDDMRLYANASLDWHMRFVRSAVPHWDAQYAKKLLKSFDLHPEQTIKGLSHGQRVKAGLLLVLARRPKLLVLDEPTTGLDPVARSEVLDELMDVLRDDSRSVFFSSHNTVDIEQICDRITFIDRGRLVQSADKEFFLDQWRRIRFEADIEVPLDSIPHAMAVKQRGKLGDLVLNADSPEARRAIEATGARIIGVDRMNLEEIFVNAVRHSRLEDAA